MPRPKRQGIWLGKPVKCGQRWRVLRRGGPGDPPHGSWIYFPTEANAKAARIVLARDKARGIMPPIAPAPTRPRLVYFIFDASNQAVKIGSAEDPQRRLGSLQVGHPATLTLLGVVDGGEDEEKRLHLEFAHLRIRGEWFRHAGALEWYLKRACLVKG